MSRDSRRVVGLAVLGAALSIGLGTVFFTSRGADPRPRAAAQVALEVYRFRPGAPALRSPAAVGPKDELAFAYRNGAGRRWLLVFVVDASGAVGWYHPADARGEAIAIRPGDPVHELRGGPRLTFPPGTLTIHAWFSDRRIAAKDVDPDDPPDDVDAVEHRLEVVP